MTELIVIRHGETDWNRQHRFQGQIDVPLNALGQTQAQRLAQRMARERVDALWSSDLLRARATADAVAQALGLDAQVEPLWREQSFGVLEGLDVPTIQREHAPLWSQWLRHDADYALPGGESMREFHARVMRALARVAASHTGQRVAVVTHGGVLDMLWRTAQAAPLHGPRTVEIPNTGLNRLHWRDGALVVLEWADAAHLAGLPEQPSTAQRDPHEP
jgi:2,3-bisphosphoglycerate-dependent phosphoglycerate mutase